jgi:hypothetical protein
MDPEEKTVEVNEDAVLDKELAETLADIKAGQEPQAQPEVKPEEEPKAEEPSNPPVEDKKEDKYEFKLPIPSKTKFESDEAYEKRVELMDLISKKKLATTEDQKQKLSEQIKDTRKEMSLLNGTDKIINPLNQVAVEKKEDPEEDEATKADKERLKQLGGATKEDIEQMFKKERFEADVTNTLKNFTERHAELKDADVRDVFFDFVEQNYNYAGKSGKDLMTVLELARESMFKPSESIQDRVLKGANVQEKINAMQFPGGTVTKAALSPEMRKSVDEMIATGMSEAKALELLSD